jgi:hypothetical protein
MLVCYKGCAWLYWGRRHDGDHACCAKLCRADVARAVVQVILFVVVQPTVLALDLQQADTRPACYAAGSFWVVLIATGMLQLVGCAAAAGMSTLLGRDRYAAAARLLPGPCSVSGSTSLLT